MQQPERNQQETSKTLEEEEEEYEKEGNVLTSKGKTKGAPLTLTAGGTSSNSDSNVGGLRRSTRAASKTPADQNILKGATVPLPDPTEHTMGIGAASKLFGTSDYLKVKENKEHLSKGSVSPGI
ncbi:hypothetical protein KEM48_006783 [Puccinia striiformis f. sp. tritici PST-130]|nr:hypothetical protein KEM48_006783 [Puccinia striiformis f. sp. tritici PST-130]